MTVVVVKRENEHWQSAYLATLVDGVWQWTAEASGPLLAIKRVVRVYRRDKRHLDRRHRYTQVAES